MPEPTAASLHPEVRPPPPERLPIPERVLTVAAHPDDAEFGAGGTLAKWAAGGSEISMLILTDGSKGTWDETLPADELIRLRREEQRRAAAAMGVRGEIVFGDHVDGELIFSPRLRAEVALWIRRLRPEVVLGFDPWHRYMLHPDHRAAGWAVVDGVVAARDHLFHPEQLREGLGKHRPRALLLWSPDAPDYWEDVSATFDTKIEALLCHTSQSQSTLGNAAEDEEARNAFVARMRARCAEMGEPVGLELGEAFKLIRP